MFSTILVLNQYLLNLVFFCVNQSCVDGQSWYKVVQETRYHGLQFRPLRNSLFISSYLTYNARKFLFYAGYYSLDSPWYIVIIQY